LAPCAQQDWRSPVRRSPTSLASAAISASRPNIRRAHASTCHNILIDADDLKDLSPISCDNGGRAYRVVQQAASATDCAAQIDDVYNTTDGVVLCVVRDY
jgi:hypothetical protein